MMDIVEERGMEIDLHRLPEMLGIPAIPVSARKKTGLSILLHAVAHHKDHGAQSPFTSITTGSIPPTGTTTTRSTPWCIKIT